MAAVDRHQVREIVNVNEVESTSDLADGALVAPRPTELTLAGAAERSSA